MHVYENIIIEIYKINRLVGTFELVPLHKLPCFQTSFEHKKGCTNFFNVSVQYKCTSPDQI